MRLLVSITYSMAMNLSKLQKILETEEPAVLQFMGSKRVRHDLVTEKQQQQSTHSLKDTESQILWSLTYCCFPDCPGYHCLRQLKPEEKNVSNSTMEIIKYGSSRHISKFILLCQ